MTGRRHRLYVCLTAPCAEAKLKEVDKRGEGYFYLDKQVIEVAKVWLP